VINRLTVTGISAFASAIEYPRQHRASVIHRLTLAPTQRVDIRDAAFTLSRSPRLIHRLTVARPRYVDICDSASVPKFAALATDRVASTRRQRFDICDRASALTPLPP
jgi:hypothetical protein